MKYIQINKHIVPLLAGDDVWVWNIAPHTFKIDAKTERELLYHYINESPNDVIEPIIDSISFDTLPAAGNQNRPRLSTFRKHFLKAHGVVLPPPPLKTPVETLGVNIFAIGALFFFFWDFMVCMGWQKISWPWSAIVLVMIGVVMSGKWLVNKCTDLSVSTHGFIDVWAILYGICVACGIADVMSTSKTAGMGNWSFYSDAAGGIGGLISIVGSCLLFIATMIWEANNLYDLYKTVNARLNK